jgi:hypothetical protein
VFFGIGKTVTAGDTTKNLNTRASSMTYDLQQGQAYANGDAKIEGEKYGNKENDSHERQFRPTFDSHEEDQVVRELFDESNGNCHNQRREDGFLTQR